MRDLTAKVERLKSTFSRLTTEEIFTALKNFEYNEDEVTMLLTKNEFIGQLRNEIAQLREKNPISAVTVKMDSINNLESFDSESDSESECESVKGPSASIVKRKIQNNNVKRASRLKLDDALTNTSGMEGWSEARIRAYKSLKKNPNTYFYRFNVVGETQRNGPWSKEEDELFMKRLGEFGADGQWGIFSMAIPGRVGYQVRLNG